MKYSNHQINIGESPVTLEITDSQITEQTPHNRTRYPRHINPRVSRNHRSYGAIFHSNISSPKTCAISHVGSVENALSILQYQLQDETAKKAHLENIKINLERRLQAAKAQGNNYLVDLLQKESRELEFS